MQRTGTILLFLLLSAGSLGAQVRWEKTFGPNGSDVCQVVMTPDGGFAMLAYLGVNGSVIRTDGAGATLWVRPLPPQDFCTILVTQDGGLITTGATRTQNRNFIAYRMDALGDSLWQHIYPDSMDQGHYQVMELDDGGFLLTGYTRTPTGSYDMYVLRTDAQGGHLWTKTYGGPAQDLGAMPTITRNGDFGFATTTSSGGNSGILMVVTDAGGNVIWDQTYTASVSIGGAVPTALSDGGYLIMGWIAHSAYNSYLIRLDSAGNVLWTKDYGGIGFETRTPKGVVEDSRGGYSFVTSTDVTYGPGLDRDMALVRVDTSGNLGEMVRVGGSAEDMPRYFQQLPDSGWVITGYSSSFIPGQQQAYLARLDPTGCDERFYHLGHPQRDTICEGDTLLLDAGQGFVSYDWSNGMTSQRIEVTVADTYWVASMDSAGCLYHSTYHIIRVRPGLAFSYLDQGNLLVDFSSLPATATAWSWDFGDGQSSSLPGPSHVYAQPGNYVVCLTADVPDCGRMTVCDTLVLTGTATEPGMATASLRLRYDAAGGQLILRADIPETQAQWIRFELWSIDGRRLRGMVIGPRGEWRIPATTIPAGMYVWRAVTDRNQTAGSGIVPIITP